MRFSCESCQTRYTIADEKVHGRVLKVRCKTCGAAIMVREAGARTVSDDPNPTPADARLETPPPRARAPEWYAMVAGRQEGPFPEADFLARIAQGAIGRRTYVWNEKLPDWRRAEDVPQLASVLPPSPATPPTPGPPTPGPPAELPEMGARPLDIASLPASSGVSPGPGSGGPAGEHTRMIMARAGVDARGQRRRTLRIAGIAAGLVVAAVATFLFLPSSVLPPAPRAAGSEGPVNDPSLWTAEGMEGLRERLLGRSPPPRRAATAPGPARAAADQGAVIRREERRAPPPVPAATKNELAALYADEAKKDVKVAKVDVAAPQADGAALDPSAVEKTIAENASAYRRCMDDYLRRNPAFRGGKIQITATIAPSGIVTAASLSDRAIDATDLGTCIKDRTKRIIFPKFSGEPFDVTYPLVLASGG